MGKYPDVFPGEVFSPSAQRENEVSHLLNGASGMSERAVSSGGKTGSITCQVTSVAKKQLLVGSVVSVISDPGDFDLLVGHKDIDFSIERAYGTACIFPYIPFLPLCGVLTQTLAPGDVGTCVLAGPVNVPEKSISDPFCNLDLKGDIKGTQDAFDLSVLSNQGGGADIFFTQKAENIRHKILCRNMSEEKIPADVCVTLCVGRDYRETGFTRGVGTPCGVTLSETDPGEIALVQLLGICRVVDNSVPTGCQEVPGMESYYIFGGGGGGYSNYFSVAVSGYSNGNIAKLRIFDGANPLSDEAGYTDIGLVRSAEIETQGKRYLCLKLESNYTQVFSMEQERPEYHLPAVIIAEVVKNRLIQRWVGGMIYWRNRFVIPSRFQEVWP